MKKIISIMLVFVILGTLFVMPTKAASYPLVFLDSTDSLATNVIPYGETGTLVFSVFREFNNEKLHVEIYDSEGYIVAESTCKYGSGGALLVTQNITFNTKTLEMTPGKYTVKYWMEFYSLYEWHNAPNSYTKTIEVIKNVCKGKHNMVFKETYTEADCKTDGLDIYQCTKCAYYRYRDVKGSHLFGKWENFDESQHQCICEVCSETKFENHRWDVGEITIKPTENSSGTKVYKCTVCGNIRNETIYKCEDGEHVFSNQCDTECDNCGDLRTAGDHIPGYWIVDKKATAGAEGTKHKECTICGEVLETAKIPKLKPSTPKLSKVESVTSGATIIWGSVTGADNYNVYRKTYDAKTKKWSGWKKIKAGTTSASYTDKTAKSGVYYRYTVIANNESGSSGFDESGVKIYYLSTPKVTSLSNIDSGITVKWGKTAGATGYYVYRKTTGGWTKVATIKGAGTLSHIDKTAKAGVTYKYTVKAYYGSYTSSNKASSDFRRLTTPTLQSVTSSKSGITFTWGKVAGATGYNVYRKTGNGGWQKIATVKGTSTVKYLDKTAKKGVTYKYTVRAYYGTSTSYYNTKGLTIKDKY